MGIISYVNEEIQVIRERDPQLSQIWKCSCIPALKRFFITESHIKLYLKKHYFLARWVSQRGKQERPGLKSIRERR